MAAAAGAQQAFCDCEKFALFDAAGQVIASNYQVPELQLQLQCVDAGMLCCVHRPTPPLPPGLASAWSQPNPAELQDLVALLDDREAAIKQGMRIDGQRYEVRGSSGSSSGSHLATSAQFACCLWA